MDMRIIEVRKNIIIKSVLTAETGFTWTINTVDFDPDEVIVKLIIYNSAAVETSVSGIYTDMVQDKFTLKNPFLGSTIFNFHLVI
jgi:hypothetical protein